LCVARSAVFVAVILFCFSRDVVAGNVFELRIARDAILYTNHRLQVAGGWNGVVGALGVVSPDAAVLT